MNCNCRTNPDTGPPEKKVPRLATEARINRRKLDSGIAPYHRAQLPPRGLSKLSYALPANPWRYLRSVASQGGNT
jgi:hypothetical protein